MNPLLLSFLNYLRFSWKTNGIGLVSTIYVVLQSANEPSIQAALHDGRLGITILIAVLGFVAKDADAHGTPQAPLPPSPPVIVSRDQLRDQTRFPSSN